MDRIILVFERCVKDAVQRGGEGGLAHVELLLPRCSIEEKEIRHNLRSPRGLLESANGNPAIFFDFSLSIACV